MRPPGRRSPARLASRSSWPRWRRVSAARQVAAGQPLVIPCSGPARRSALPSPARPSSSGSTAASSARVSSGVKASLAPSTSSTWPRPRSRSTGKGGSAREHSTRWKPGGSLRQRASTRWAGGLPAAISCTSSRTSTRSLPSCCSSTSPRTAAMPSALAPSSPSGPGPASTAAATSDGRPGSRRRSASTRPRTNTGRAASSRSRPYQEARTAAAQLASRVDLPYPGPATTVVRRRCSAPSRRASSSGRSTQAAGSAGGRILVAGVRTWKAFEPGRTGLLDTVCPPAHLEGRRAHQRTAGFYDRRLPGCGRSAALRCLSLSQRLAVRADAGEQVALVTVAGDQRARQGVVLPWVDLGDDLVRDGEPEAVGVDLGGVRDQRVATLGHVPPHVHLGGDIRLGMLLRVPPLQPLAERALDATRHHAGVDRLQPLPGEGGVVVELEGLERGTGVGVAVGVARRLERGHRDLVGADVVRVGVAAALV